MKCIIGLGNPGEKYKYTRHNIGFLAIDEIARRENATLSQHKYKCDFDIIQMNGEKVMLVKPQTFMNLSGEGVRPLMDYFNIAVEDIAVIYDDLDLPGGKIRLREKGGHGGHNGIRSLITHLGTKEFKRIRLGIGRPHHQMAVVDYVLQRFGRAEEEELQRALDLAAKSVDLFVTKTFHHAMNEYNNS